jgi:hypothetical protein
MQVDRLASFLPLLHSAKVNKHKRHNRSATTQTKLFVGNRLVCLSRGITTKRVLSVTMGLRLLVSVVEKSFLLGELGSLAGGVARLAIGHGFNVPNSVN